MARGLPTLTPPSSGFLRPEDAIWRRFFNVGSVREKPEFHPLEVGTTGRLLAKLLG